jgi:DNA-directed RNA polymerase specialized sigma24 family protein
MDFRAFVLSSVRPPAADDITQEVAKAFATGMKNFKGNSKEEFWGWSYSIARNEINDYLRKKSSERIRWNCSQTLLGTPIVRWPSW